MKGVEPLFITRAQARTFDRDAMERRFFPGVVLMENAGRGCVDVMERVGIDGPVLVLCGGGNNAGDGFVIARHLTVRGYECRIALTAPPAKLRGDARRAFEMLITCHRPILDLSGVGPSISVNELDEFDHQNGWIVDALLGTGSTGVPRPPMDAVIEWMNAEPVKRLAVDLPSGLDCDTGEPAPTTVRADHTCTFVAQKVGFQNPTAAEFLGEVHVVDIGVPAPI